MYIYWYMVYGYMVGWLIFNEAVSYPDIDGLFIIRDL